MKASKYEAAMKSVIGTREEQQDYGYYKVDNQRVVALVCDGMGGLDSGTIASTVATNKFKELYEHKNPAQAIPEFLLNSVDILDEYVFHLKDEEGKKLAAGTTLVAAIIENDSLFWLSVGDSRLYILRGNEFVQVTRDHNYFLKLNQMLKEDAINQEQYSAEAKKGEALISFIGLGGIDVMDINNTPFKLLHGDIILLSSDGLYKALSDDEIALCLQKADIENSLEALISKASDKAKMSQDNTTCIIIKYEAGRGSDET